MRSTGIASLTNSCSMATASMMIFCTTLSGAGFCSMLKSRHAKSQCMPSSREMSSFENVSPGIRPRFLSQKMAQNEPEEGCTSG